MVDRTELDSAEQPTTSTAANQRLAWAKPTIAVISAGDAENTSGFSADGSAPDVLIS
jgi:hypothetical protein